MPRSPQFWTNHTLFEVGEYTNFFLIITRSCGLCSPKRSALLVMTTEHFRRRFKAKWHDSFLRTSNFISVTEADHHGPCSPTRRSPASCWVTSCASDLVQKHQGRRACVKEPIPSSAQNIVRKDVKKCASSIRNECDDGSMRFEKMC